MRIRRIPILAAAVAMLALATPGAFAEAYLGVSAGSADFELDQSAVRFNFDGTSYKAFGGFKFKPWLAGELQYVNLDGLEATVGAIDAEFDGEVVNLFAVASVRIAPRVEVWAKVGGSWWNSTVKVTPPDEPTSPADDNGTEFCYGAGIGFLATQHFGVRLEWETFGDLGDARNVKYLSVGVQYSF